MVDLPIGEATIIVDIDSISIDRPGISIITIVGLMTETTDAVATGVVAVVRMVSKINDHNNSFFDDSLFAPTTSYSFYSQLFEFIFMPFYLFAIVNITLCRRLFI